MFKVSKNIKSYSIKDKRPCIVEYMRVMQKCANLFHDESSNAKELIKSSIEPNLILKIDKVKTEFNIELIDKIFSDFSDIFSLFSETMENSIEEFKKLRQRLDQIKNNSAKLSSPYSVAPQQIPLANTLQSTSLVSISQSVPPIPQSVPPIPQSVPPIPQTNPSVPQSVPPIPQSVPPIPQSVPPVPQSVLPVPQSVPPISQSVPPVSQSVPPVPQPIPLVSQLAPQVSQSVLPTPQLEHPPPTSDQQELSSAPFMVQLDDVYEVPINAPDDSYEIPINSSHLSYDISNDSYEVPVDIKVNATKFTPTHTTTAPPIPSDIPFEDSEEENNNSSISVAPVAVMQPTPSKLIKAEEPLRVQQEVKKSKFSFQSLQFKFKSKLSTSSTNVNIPNKPLRTENTIDVSTSNKLEEKPIDDIEKSRNIEIGLSDDTQSINILTKDLKENIEDNISTSNLSTTNIDIEQNSNEGSQNESNIAETTMNSQPILESSEEIQKTTNKLDITKEKEFLDKLKKANASIKKSDSIRKSFKGKLNINSIGTPMASSTSKDVEGDKMLPNDNKVIKKAEENKSIRLVLNKNNINPKNPVANESEKQKFRTLK